MSCINCVSIFEDAPESEGRVDAINRAAPHQICEPHQVSPYCTDPIDSGETLVRFVVDPNHLEIENGVKRIKSSFFSESMTIGASTLRMGRAEAAEYEAALTELVGYGPQIERRADITLYGVLLIPVSEVRSIDHRLEVKDPPRTDIYKAFGVYATGMKDKPNHADIMVSHMHVEGMSKSKLNRACKRLAKAMEGNLISVANYGHVGLARWAK